MNPMSKLPVPSDNNPRDNKPPKWPEDLAAFENLHVYLEKVREGEPDGDFISSVFSILCNSMNPSAAIWWEPTEGGLRWKNSRFVQIDDTHAQCPYTNDVVACAESVIREEEPDIFVCDNPLPDHARKHSSDRIGDLVTGCKQLLLPLRTEHRVVAVFTFFDQDSTWTLDALAALQEQIEWVMSPKSSPAPRSTSRETEFGAASPERIESVQRDAQAPTSHSSSTSAAKLEANSNSNPNNQAKDDAQILREMRQAARAAQSNAIDSSSLQIPPIESDRAGNTGDQAESGAPEIQSPSSALSPTPANPQEKTRSNPFTQSNQPLTESQIEPNPNPAPMPQSSEKEQPKQFASKYDSLPSSEDDLDAIDETGELRLQRMAAAAVAIVGRSLDETECCFDVANELDNLLDADRVTVCLNRGGRCKVKAISNQPVFDARSAHVKVIEDLASFAANSQAAIWHPQDADSLPSTLAGKFETYYEISDGQSIALIPLIKKTKRKRDPEDLSSILASSNAFADRVTGVVVIEGLAQAASKIRSERVFKLVGDPVVNALSNASEHSSLFLMPLWRNLSRFKDLFIGHHRRKAISIAVAILLAAAALFAIPSDLKLRSEGTIQPSGRRNVFASTSGVIDEILVEDGDQVEAGQVLLRLSDPALAAEFAKVEGTLRESEERLRTNRLQRMRGKFESEEHRKASVLEAAGLQASLENLREQHSLLAEKIEQLVIRSPMDGMVISWDTRRKLIHRPVETGQKLLAVAKSDGQWELELKLADQRSGYLRSIWPESNSELEDSQRPKATYVLASEPTKVYSGQVRDWSRRADVDEKLGNVVRVYVDANGLEEGATQSLRPGTEVIAQIHVGRRSLGYCKLFEFFDWVQRVWFKYV